jgi:transposase InsO family protein
VWLADITYVAIATGFVYLAVVLDVWSRRVVGYALGRAIEARPTLVALDVAIGRGNRGRAASTIPIVAANMLRNAIVRNWQTTASKARWGGAEIRMITRRQKDS